MLHLLNKACPHLHSKNEVRRINTIVEGWSPEFNYPALFPTFMITVHENFSLVTAGSSAKTKPEV